MKLRLTLVLALGLSSPILAATSGTVSGTFDHVDDRENVYTQRLGYTVGLPPGGRIDFGNGATARPFGGVLIEVTATHSGGNAVFYGCTTSAGTYSVNWATPTTATNLRIRVTSVYPKNCSVGPTDSNTRFVVSAVGVSWFILREKNTTSPGTTINHGTLTIGASEAARVFRTGREVFQMWYNQGVTSTGLRISDHVDNLHIDINSSEPTEGNGTGCSAPSSEHIYCQPGTGVAGHVIAHEMGHSMHWVALQTYLADMTFSDFDYGFDLGSWDDTSEEWQKTAFFEGFATINEAMWEWNRDADPPANLLQTGSSSPTTNPRVACHGIVPGGCDLESANFCSPSSPSQYNQPYRLVLCHVRGIWDLLDNAPTDGDGITSRDLSNVFDVWRAYPELPGNCFTNHCSHEGYPWDAVPDNPDTPNWKDFRHHWINELGEQADVDNIQEAVGLDEIWDF